jgi:dolichol-phosphate mannosyltransferase
VDVSIVIPTFNESENVSIITKRIDDALAAASISSYEIWFIDDSVDNTPLVLEELSKQNPHVRYVHRTTDRGLGKAVVEGFQRASGQYLIVMDADLQHPPEVLPIVIQRLTEGIEVVIPSRFVPGGSDGGLSPVRKFISWTARAIGRVSIRRLRDISDCTGGFFGVQRTVVEDTALDPIGWKILMEVLVKGNYTRVHEVPYEFVPRYAGDSKMSMHEQWNYLRHVAKLVRSSPDDRRFYMFCFVGVLGVIVNLVVLSIMLHIFHMHPLASSIVASLVAMGNNFLWNDLVTWKGQGHAVWWRRALKFPLFAVVSGVGIAVTALFAQAALWLHLPEILGQLIGIVVATAWGFLANNKWTWSNKVKQKKVKVTQEYV